MKVSYETHNNIASSSGVESRLSIPILNQKQAQNVCVDSLKRDKEIHHHVWR
jgi:hypothetical protein